MRKRNKRRHIIAVLIFALVMALAPVSGMQADAATTVPVSGTQADASTTAPSAVKGLKKVKVTKNSIKIKYKKVKGAEGYKIWIYDRTPLNGKRYKTPLLYVRTTKKTTYTMKPLVGGSKYVIKVASYNKEGICGKRKSITVNTPGNRTDFMLCNACCTAVPYYRGNKKGWDYSSWLAEHIGAVWDEFGELHAGSVFY